MYIKKITDTAQFITDTAQFITDTAQFITVYHRYSTVYFKYSPLFSLWKVEISQRRTPSLLKTRKVYIK